MPFRVEYTQEARDHLKALTASQRVTVFDAVDEQLIHEPHIETKRRKPLRPNPVAPWELRIGSLRVFYDFDEADQRVTVLAIGIKSHNVLRIGGEEVEL